MGIFDDDNYNANRYGIPDREGTPADWKAAYEDRMGRDEYEEVLGSTKTAQTREQEAIIILEITETTITEDVIKQSYRRIVKTECKSAFDLNPDKAAELLFKRIKAAYSLLMDLYG